MSTCKSKAFFKMLESHIKAVDPSGSMTFKWGGVYYRVSAEYGCIVTWKMEDGNFYQEFCCTPFWAELDGIPVSYGVEMIEFPVIPFEWDETMRDANTDYLSCLDYLTTVAQHLLSIAQGDIEEVEA